MAVTLHLSSTLDPLPLNQHYIKETEETELASELAQLAFENVNSCSRRGIPTRESVKGVVQAYDFGGCSTSADRKLYQGTSFVPYKLFRQEDLSRFLHGFVSAVLVAWDSHRPLILSPDHFWLLILQGVSDHVTMHSDKVRDGFVNFSGKQTLTVVRDHFVLDSSENDWEGVVEEFVAQIDQFTCANTTSLLTPKFSTTSHLTMIAAKVTVMDVCKSFFNYLVLTRCGFPSVMMEGSANDWKQLRERTESLLDSDKLVADFAKDWRETLLPILAKLEKQAADPSNPDTDFWNSMVKIDGSRGSGAYSWMNGWLNKFFPYWQSTLGGEKQRNPFCFMQEHFSGLCSGSPRPPNLCQMPKGISIAPAIWRYWQEEFALSFLSGFMGFEERSDLLKGGIRPRIGWLIVRRAEEGGKPPHNSS